MIYLLDIPFKRNSPLDYMLKIAFQGHLLIGAVSGKKQIVGTSYNLLFSFESFLFMFSLVLYLSENSIYNSDYLHNIEC